MRYGYRCAITIFATLAFGVVGATVASAARHPVELGEVTARARTASPKMVGHFRASLAEAIEALALPTKPGKPTYVLSAAVVRIDERRHEGALETNVVVSATLRERESGALRAILRSSGSAEGRAQDSRRDALGAAARGAVGRVPEALP